MSDTTTTSDGRRERLLGGRYPLDGVTKVYPGQPTPAVDAFSMTVEPGELIMFVGPRAAARPRP